MKGRLRAGEIHLVYLPEEGEKGESCGGRHTLYEYRVLVGIEERVAHRARGFVPLRIQGHGHEPAAFADGRHLVGSGGDDQDAAGGIDFVKYGTFDRVEDTEGGRRRNVRDVQEVTV